MFALNIIAQFFVGEGCTVTATRVVFAYSRDGAIPGSRWWSQVHPRTKTPVYATWGVLTVSALLGLLMFASPVAIGAIFSIGAIAQYTAFTTPVALKLFFDNGRFKPGKLSAWACAHVIANPSARSLASRSLVEAIGGDCFCLVVTDCSGSLLPGRQGQRLDSSDYELDLPHLWRRNDVGNVMVCD